MKKTSLVVLFCLLFSASLSAERVSASRRNTFWIDDEGDLWGLGDTWAITGSSAGSAVYPHRIDEDVTMVSSGVQTVYYIKKDGSLWGLGDNRSGQLGVGDDVFHFDPVFITNGVKQVSAGDRHCLYLTDDGHLYGMGSNRSGQLALKEDVIWTYTPTHIDSDVKFIEAGPNNSFYIKGETNNLWAIGENTEYQLGALHRTDVYEPLWVDTRIIKVSAGTYHTLLIDEKHNLLAVGRKNSFKIFPDEPQSGHYNQFTEILDDGNIKDISAGVFHSLVLATQGDNDVLYGLGDNTYSQMGTLFVYLHDMAKGVECMSAGSYHSVWLTNNGIVWGVGANNYQQLGAAHLQDNEPRMIAHASGGRHTIAAGIEHSLFIKNDGSLWAVGGNTYGQLGNGTQLSTDVPVQIDTDVAQVWAGGYHTLYLKNDQTLMGMGRNDKGQLGLGSYAPTVAFPTLISKNVINGGAGKQHSFFINRDFTLWGMGDNTSVQLGRDFANGTTFNKPTVVAQNVFEVDGGDNHSLITLVNGELYSSGLNKYGQLGLGDQNDRLGITLVGGGNDWYWDGRSGMFRFEKISAGAEHSAIIDTRMDLFAAGKDTKVKTYPRLGLADSSRFIDVENRVSAVSAGNGFTLYATELYGTLYGTGNNKFGQLGEGEPEVITAQEIYPKDVVEVSAGENHTLFRTKTGGVWALGNNERGQLGIGDTDDRNDPKLVGGFDVSRMDYSNDGYPDLITQSANSNVIVGKPINHEGEIIESEPTWFPSTYATGYKQLINFVNVDQRGGSDFIYRSTDGLNNYTIHYRGLQDGIIDERTYNPFGSNWRMVGVYDFDSDGVTDFLWQDINTGRIVIWFRYEEGTLRGASTLFQSMNDWRVAAVGDLDKDGNMDLVCQKTDANSTRVQAWYLDNNGNLKPDGIKQIGNRLNSYRCVGLADHNSDGILDIVWQNSSNYKIQVTLLNKQGDGFSMMQLSNGEDRMMYPHWQWNYSK